MDFLPPLLNTVLSFIVILSIIVFIHEFGHYLVARLCGVRITAFSIGFGKELFGFNDRHGTRWKVSALPLGGYVKMFGDAGEASTPDKAGLQSMSPEERAVSFHYKPLHQKAAIVAAGPLANLLLTIGIFTYFIFAYGMEVTEPIVGEIMPDTPAATSGLQSGDRILSVDGHEVSRFNDIPRYVMTNLGTPVEIVYERGEDVRTLNLTPQIVKQDDGLGNTITRPLIGIKSKRITQEDVSFPVAVMEASRKTWDITVTTFDYLGQLVTGDRGTEDLRGPIGIAKLSGQAAEQGFYTVLWLMALLSANLGMVNLFPIPPLDGGHLMYYMVEGARGRPMAERYQELGYRAGFAMILVLMVFTIYNDIRQF